MGQWMSDEDEPEDHIHIEPSCKYAGGSPSHRSHKLAVVCMEARGHGLENGEHSGRTGGEATAIVV